MSRAFSFEREEWFDVTDHIGDVEAVSDIWLDEIESRIAKKQLDFVQETFLRAGLRVYRRARGNSVAAKEVFATAGYSKSTFHRMFDGFASYQLKLYHFLGNMAVDVYEDYLNRRERTPEEFCRFTRDCIYSSHLAIPKSTVSDVYRLNSPISPDRFHPFVIRSAEVMSEYIRLNRHLGYRTFTQDGLTEVIRTLDYDILFSSPT